MNVLTFQIVFGDQLPQMKGRHTIYDVTVTSIETQFIKLKLVLSYITYNFLLFTDIKVKEQSMENLMR